MTTDGGTRLSRRRKTPVTPTIAVATPATTNAPTTAA
jgi:hypothetical protein